MKKRLISLMVVVAMAQTFMTAVFAENTTFEYSWDFADNTQTDKFTWVNNGSGFIADIDGAIGWVPAKGGNGYGDGALNNNSNGITLLESELANNKISDTSFVVSVDFMTKSDEMKAHLIAPKLDNGKLGDYTMAVTLGLGGTITCNGEYIGKIRPYEWHNVSAKYTHSSETGLTADVYLDGELKAEGIRYSYGKDPIYRFDVRAVSQTSDAMRQISTRFDRRNEKIYIDNLYIGSDVSKVEYPFGISNVENRTMKELDVRFNQSVDGKNISADSLLISDSEGGVAGSIVSAEAVDSNTVRLILDTALTANTEYTILSMYNTFSAYTFTPHIALFYDFNYESGTVPETFVLNSKHNVYLAPTEGAYGTGEDDKDFCFTTFPSSNQKLDGNYDKYTNGYNVYTTPNSEIVKEGMFTISFDFKVDSDELCGYLIAPRSVDPEPEIVVQIKDKAIICGTNKIADLEKGVWHNITATYIFVPGGVLTDVYYDGEKKVDAKADTYIDGITQVSTLITAKTSDEAYAIATRPSARGEIFHMDNFYMNVDSEYKTSDFNAYFDADNAVISSGAFANSGTAFVALYDGDSLKQVKMCSFELEGLRSIKLSTLFDEYEEGNVIKLICLEDMDSLTPKAEAVIK